MNRNELAVAGDFKVVSPLDGMDPDLLAEIQDEMGDIDSDGSVDFLRIKVPSGGGQAFEVQAEDGNVEYLKELDCVIVYTHKTNSWWGADFGASQDGSSPICSSMDGKIGVNTETGRVMSCATCPNNQYGSAIGPNGDRGRGKACKNMSRLYLLLSGSPDLYMLTVPPTSMRDVDRALKKMLMSGMSYTGTVIRLSLERTVNAAGVNYSKIKLTKLGVLPADQRQKVTRWRDQIKTDRTQTAAIQADRGSNSIPVLEPAKNTPAPEPVAPDQQHLPPAQKAPITGTQMPIFEEAEDVDSELPF